MPDWTIRPARPEDAPALTECVASAYSEYASRIADLPPVTEGLSEDIRDHVVFVAEADGAILGGAVLVLADGAKLANLAVRPEAGGQGLGRALIAAVEDRARAAGVDALRLTTHAGMPETIAFYERLGWTEIGRRGNAVTMTRSL